MDIGLLKSTFAGDVGTKPTLLEPIISPRTGQPATMPPDNTGETETADNKQAVTQNIAVVDLSKNFKDTLDKKIKKQDQDSETLSEMVQPTAQGVPAEPLVLDNPAGDAKLQQQAESQIPGEAEQAVTDSALPGSQQTPSLIAGELNQIVSTTAESANKPIQPTIDQNQIKSEIISPDTSNKLPVSNTPFEKGNDIAKTQVFDEAFAAKEKPIDQQNQQSGKEPIPETLISSRKITADSELPIVINEPFAARLENGSDIAKTQVSDEAFLAEEPIPETLISNYKITADSDVPVVTNEPSAVQPGKDNDIAKAQVSDEAFAAKEKIVDQENQQSGKEPIPKTLINNYKATADSKLSIVTNEPSAAESPKTQISNGSPAAPGDQLSYTQQKVLAGQSTAEQTTPGKTDIDQKNRPGKMELSGLSENNGVQAKNSSVTPIAQNINPQQTRLSDAHAEIHKNSVSNHTSGQNTGEQLLGNNIQPAITEQPPTSPAHATFAKSAGNADSGASVGSQIQESIHSSFQSGNQQIVIRLNPPELGKVDIRFTEQGDNITALLQVDKLQTKDRIQQALPEVIQNLQNAGIQIKRVEVVLTNQQEQYNSKDQSSLTGQNGWSGQQSSPNPESSRNNAIYNEWLTDIDYVPEYMEPQMQFTENSVNMLA
ncbi:MAG: flagellar hook-length control protein FliK [Phycisphaerae bacterium]|jgi:flagellar hook-length control protein FliK